MAEPRIVRNRLKIEAAVTNARATVALREQGGLVAFVETFRPDVPPRPRPPSRWWRRARVVALSKGLKKQGFAFVGPTTMYALMEAIGLVDDHLVGCHRRGCARASDAAYPNWESGRGDVPTVEDPGGDHAPSRVSIVTTARRRFNRRLRLDAAVDGSMPRRRCRRAVAVRGPGADGSANSATDRGTATV